MDHEAKKVSCQQEAAMIDRHSIEGTETEKVLVELLLNIILTRSASLLLEAGHDVGRPALPVGRSFGAHPVERVSTSSRRVQFCSLLLFCRVLVAAAAAGSSSSSSTV
jgi:hypothetical protein